VPEIHSHRLSASAVVEAGHSIILAESKPTDVKSKGLMVIISPSIVAGVSATADSLLPEPEPRATPVELATFAAPLANAAEPNLHQSVRELRGEVKALRHDVRQLLELLEKSEPNTSSALEAAPSNLEMRSYNVADLVVPLPGSPPQASEWSEAPEPNDILHGLSNESTRYLLNSESMQDNYTSLMRIVRQRVQPDSWGNEGIAIEPYLDKMSLVVRHTGETHDKIAALFERMRRQLDVQVSLDMRVIDVPETLLERVGLELPNPIGAAGVVVTDHEITRLIVIGETDQRATVRQAAKICVFNDQLAHVEFEFMHGSTSAQSVHVRPTVLKSGRDIHPQLLLNDPQSADAKQIAAVRDVQDGDTLVLAMGEFEADAVEDGVLDLSKVPYVTLPFKSPPKNRVPMRRYLLIRNNIEIQEPDAK
jgi:hypothetical protein